MRTKGFVFTIDATLALFLMVLVLITIIFLSAQADESPYVNLHMLRIGKDTLSVMDKQGILTSGNVSLMNSSLNSTLQRSIGAHVEISTYYYDEGGFNFMSITQFGSNIPANASIYVTSRDFVAMSNGRISNYSIARMTLWQK